MAARYVVLGLALTRSSWFRSVSQWSHSASIPVEFVKVVSPIELRAHLASGRPFSAVLVDAAVPHFDRDLVDDIRSTGCAVIVVDDVRANRDWSALGVDAVINPVFDRRALLDVLAARASEIVRPDALPGDVDLGASDGTPPALTVMVCGPGGTGTSTAAIGLAQGLSAHRFDGGVLLADLAKRGDQAMLHDAGDVVPGVQELVEAHRSGRVAPDDAVALTYLVAERGYRLLLGLRRRRNWASIRPRAFAAALDTITTAWSVVVCDTDGDLEGEEEGGSADVEDRNVMARTVGDRADVVAVVGQPGVKGIHSMVGLVAELLDHGVPAERILPVVNRAPRGPRARSEIAAAFAALLDHRGAGTASPLFLPDAEIDGALRDGVRLPSKFVAPLTSAVQSMSERLDRRLLTTAPVPVVAGSLGSWSGAAAR